MRNPVGIRCVEDRYRPLYCEIRGKLLKLREGSTRYDREHNPVTARIKGVDVCCDWQQGWRLGPPESPWVYSCRDMTFEIMARVIAGEEDPHARDVTAADQQE